ncbi:MAG: hypothetical protein A2725_03820 [Candidatus Magasanikbacteria bacterium RIFCSPHIGHO2_01_FULL_33_34]|uniref:Uncharacterized protein n=1 Tax=Candidatus Magasanikbacteria bacterium RIFCSPHIGHO2_01_FULL_33_34 TaxID=1798671 RepID=A0A1F6LHE8_9BACT|nr:MAG: hypothetical protein A2725_03820 [Candidatus Magasanikbacteria bacterium RIFCSPHIGHO2_01_FULL_33_34]OGH65098.1 MAG: hypothetical protein A3B83_03580 [Candidatus Magasanikbacteria bacterium RIFCSPHIGHO2_02_FULL_33_17]OGH75358.1 MAG: hypothetical protein A3A89_04585 [Candidatus Magasanikbacteria bacterium RIFCSPLOWO2_01_FULL_33_34]OGH81808.1 MAG: hypothetical protein A3F93_03475 [Candidatus Magasanikbacteria bacterium RIFCSPLOWO2_12_FULL_34_7]
MEKPKYLCFERIHTCTKDLIRQGFDSFQVGRVVAIPKQTTTKLVHLIVFFNKKSNKIIVYMVFQDTITLGKDQSTEKERHEHGEKTRKELNDLLSEHKMVLDTINNLNEPIDYKKLYGLSYQGF